MGRPGTGTGANPPNKEQNIGFVHTAVLEGIAVFFCSTSFCLFLFLLTIFNKYNHAGASALRRMRFSFVGKRDFLFGWDNPFSGKAYRPRCRSPPVSLDFSKIQTDWRYSAWMLTKNKYG